MADDKDSIDSTDDPLKGTAGEAKKASISLRFTNTFYALFEMTAVIALIYFAVFGISEVSSREAFSGTVAAKIAELNSELANVSANLSTDVDAAVPSSVLEQRKRLTFDQAVYRDLSDRISNLINVGVDDVEGELRHLTRLYQEVAFGSADEAEASLAPPIGRYTTSSYLFIRPLNTARSDHLLALSIICCSALGAVIFGLRQGVQTNLRTMTSGLATGFVVYLALKGGQHIFIISSPDVRFPTNPYSSAFAGLLAGLFSDRAYRLLSSLVHSVASRVEKAAGAGPKK